VEAVREAKAKAVTTSKCEGGVSRGEPSLVFARFDAFKYAENPLRRNFISAVATELKVKDQKFHADFYSGQTKTTFNVPKLAFLRLAPIYGMLLFGIFFALMLIAAAAYVEQGGFWEDFRPPVKQVVVAAFTPAAEPNETRGGHALCATSSSTLGGGLIQAMAGGLGGVGRRVNRSGLAA